MKIAVDISQIVYKTGVSVYTENLVKNLLLIDKENKYSLFAGTLRRSSDIKEFVSGLEGRVTAKVFPFPPTLTDLVWNRLHFLKVENFIGKVDVFHSSDWSQPPSGAFKVTTVHDLAPILFPQLTPPSIVSAHRARLEWVKKEVNRIIAPSNSTKKDLVNLGYKDEKIIVIYEGVDDIFQRQSEEKIKALKKKYRIDGDYLLIVGTGARKNIKNMVTAFERVRPGKNLKLVIVGGGKVEETRGIISPGFVSQEELITFYSGAEALLYASIYEGFGQNILEAFACSCPVVTSNVSSMPEVAADAAVLVDPQDASSITEGIREAMKDRKRLISKGLRRVKDFSWERTAKETLGVYREANK